MKKINMHKMKIIFVVSHKNDFFLARDYIFVAMWQ